VTLKIHAAVFATVIAAATMSPSRAQAFSRPNNETQGWLWRESSRTRPGQPDPYSSAAASAQVPLDLLVAIAGAESGYHPWALNVAGRQKYCRSRAEAERLLASNDNVDIGLMQINWSFWGRRLGLSKNELLDPRVNLLCGARILRKCLDGGGGDIWRRISDYHAGTTSTRNRYNQRVYSSYIQYLHGATR